MATVEEVLVVVNQILSAMVTRPDGGDWGSDGGDPADYSVWVRQDQPAGSGASPFKMEDVPMAAQTVLGRLTGEDIKALSIGELQVLLTSAGLTVGDNVTSNPAITFDGPASDQVTTFFDDAGGFVTLDGANDYGTAIDDASLDFSGTGDFAVIFWLRTTSLANSRLFAKYDLSGGRTGYYGWYLGASNRLRFRITDAGADVDCDADVFVADGKPHQYLAVRDASTDIKIYVDGILRCTTASVASDLRNSDQFVLGADRTLGSKFDGSLSEFAIYDSITDFNTAAKALLAYKHGFHNGLLINTNLAAYWKLDTITGGGPDGSIEDESANSNTITAISLVQADVTTHNPTLDKDQDEFIDGDQRVTGEARVGSLYSDGDTILGADGDVNIKHEGDGDWYFKDRGPTGVQQTEMWFDSSLNTVRIPGPLIAQDSLEIDGYLDHQGATLSFFAEDAVQTKITVTGDKESNSALASLISALVSYGLITDSTT